MFIWSFSKVPPRAMVHMGPDGHLDVQPGMLDVTAEVQAAAAAQGVTLNPVNLFCDYGVELMPMDGGPCPDGSQPSPDDTGRHYSWTAFSDKPRGGFSSMKGCGKLRFLVCSMVTDRDITVSGTVIQP